MTRDQLEHAIRAAADVVGDTELWVFGSQSILGQHPDAPDALRMSIEVDVDPINLLPLPVDRRNGLQEWVDTTALEIDTTLEDSQE